MTTVRWVGFSQKFTSRILINVSLHLENSSGGENQTRRRRTMLKIGSNRISASPQLRFTKVQERTHILSSLLILSTAFSFRWSTNYVLVSNPSQGGGCGWQRRWLMNQILAVCVQAICPLECQCHQERPSERPTSHPTACKAPCLPPCSEPLRSDKYK